jgi:drug/metabolite transporter (DMT)-like permease
VTRSIYLFKIIPMSLCFAYSLAAGNMAYTYLSVAYIQMLKSFTPVPMLFMSYLTGRESPAFVQLSLILLISTGVALASVGEAKFSLIGFFLQLSAVFADVTRTTLVDLTLQDLKLDSLSLLYYLMPLSCVFIGLGFYVHESAHFHWDLVLETSFGWVVLSNGMLAFLLNVSSYDFMTYMDSIKITLVHSGLCKIIIITYG